MAKSKWEKYIVRTPAILIHQEKGGVKEIVPKTKPIPRWSPVDTGPQVIMTNKLVPEAGTMIEYAYISGDHQVGIGNNLVPAHKHDYDEIFIFAGTDPNDVSDLGGEVEFWIGEGKDFEKVIFNTSSSIFMPRGTAHFPLIFRNVKRPILHIVVMPDAKQRVLKKEISTEGRK
jgi:hypothetical protein